MFKKKASLLFILIVLTLVVILGLKYRLRSYESYPPIASSFDEQVVVWVGSSLINNGVPTGWSFIEDYISDNRGHLVRLNGWSISYDGRIPSFSNFSQFPKPLAHPEEVTLDGYTSQFTFVQPYLEQPPLGTVMASFLSGSYKKTGFDQVTLKEIRLPVIYISAVVILLVFLIGFLNYGLWVGFLSAAIYALTPTVIVTNRLSVSENYLTVFIVLGVLLTQLWIRSSKKYYLFFVCLLIIICYLIKPFGLLLSVVLVLAILAFDKKKIYLIYPTLASLIAVAIYFIYGNIYSPEVFKSVVNYQTGRYISPLHGIFKILLPKITKIFLDGWIIFGWLAIASIAFKNNIKTDFWVLGPTIGFLLMFMLFGGEDYGWYRLLIYPFLSIASGFLIIDGIKRANFWIFVLFLVTIFSTSVYWGTFGMDWIKSVNIFRAEIILLVGVALFSFWGGGKLKFAGSLALLLILLISFWFNLQTINNMQLIWPTLGDDTSIMPMRH